MEEDYILLKISEKLAIKMVWTEVNQRCKTASEQCRGGRRPSFHKKSFIKNSKITSELDSPGIGSPKVPKMKQNQLKSME
ncbi:unnamed protein product [Cuscuta campestris]|uniref:Uncharacterized protein n=1 Tax=Cuscuta campestris TaxID=132261 RepID=A0A484M2Z7_9ASTE|nr:unnamed protein product [Cuscuta campestris]